MSKLPAYYISRSLLNGEPDCNRRTIYRTKDDEIVCVFNREMKEWTKRDEAECQACLAALLSLPAE